MKKEEIIAEINKIQEEINEIQNKQELVSSGNHFNFNITIKSTLRYMEQDKNYSLLILKMVENYLYSKIIKLAESLKNA